MSTFSRLPDDVLTELRRLGFVHVSGLETTTMFGSTQKKETIEANQMNCGKWEVNHGMAVIVTVDGQVWCAAIRRDTYQAVETLAKKLCPNGRGVFVPLSNGESVVHSSYLFTRFADPYEDGEMTVSRIFNRARAI